MQVSLIAAISADGFIAKDSVQPSFEWTSPEDKQFYVNFIKKTKFVIMGSKSFSTFTKYPKGLTFVIYTSRPEKFVNPKPWVIETIATKAGPKQLLEELADKGCTEVAICGGASIYTMFMKSGLVNRIYLTMEPVFFGSGVKLFGEKTDIKVRLSKIHNLSDQTKVMEYEVLKT
jgi:dihydrofolate reductase